MPQLSATICSPLLFTSLSRLPKSRFTTNLEDATMVLCQPKRSMLPWHVPCEVPHEQTTTQSSNPKPPLLGSCFPFSSRPGNCSRTLARKPVGRSARSHSATFGHEPFLPKAPDTLSGKVFGHIVTLYRNWRREPKIVEDSSVSRLLSTSSIHSSSTSTLTSVPHPPLGTNLQLDHTCGHPSLLRRLWCGLVKSESLSRALSRNW